MQLKRIGPAFDRVYRIEQNSNLEKIEQANNDLQSKIEQTNNGLQTQIDGLLEGEFEEAALSTHIEKKLNDLETQYAPKLAEVTTQLADVSSMYWKPPAQPPARTDRPGWFANGFVWTSEEYTNKLFEPLRASNPDYITRDSLGKDASGLYDVWRYYFTPKQFKKTIIIGTCIHGGEVTPMMAMYRFFVHMIDDWDKYPQLAYIRNNVRIIFIPFQNPWGVNQSPRKRQNSNGVDINRNFDYKWSEYTPQYNQAFGHDYKGTAPFSEVESQYIRNVLRQHPDATAYLDLHNFGDPGYHYVIYNSPNASNQFVYDDLINYLTKDINSPSVLNETQDTPSAYNYSTNVMKKVSGNPEWADGQYSTKYDSVEMTKALEWYANIILQHVREDLFLAEEAFIIENYYARTDTGNLNLPVGTSAKIEPFDFSFKAPCDGLVTFEGTVTLKGSDNAAVNYITPRIGQLGTDFAPGAVHNNRNQVYSEGALRQTIPFLCQTYVKRTAPGVGDVGIGLLGYTTVGTCTIFRYKGRITFTPSKHLNKFQIYNASRREAEGTNAMIKEY